MTRPRPTFAEALVEVALGERGVREVGHNGGPRVNEYQAAAGASDGDPWCMSYVYWCGKKAARRAGLKVVPLPRTASVYALIKWAKRDGFWVPMHEARDNPSQIEPGWLWCKDYDDGKPDSVRHKGHVGIVTARLPSMVLTVEGNSQPKGAREGDGVYHPVDRPIAASTGFVRL